MKATSGFLFGSAFTAVAGVVWKVIRFLAECIGKVIYYFGLYHPLAYIIYGVVLYFVFKLNPFDLTVDGRLYLFGFVLSMIACIIQAIKNLIIKPFNKYFKKSNVVEYGKQQKLSADAPEAPKIYKSKVNKGVTVYEYANRYDLYEDDRHGGLQLVSTEYKQKHKKRW